MPRVRHPLTPPEGDRSMRGSTEARTPRARTLALARVRGPGRSTEARTPRARTLARLRMKEAPVGGHKPLAALAGELTPPGVCLHRVEAAWGDVRPKTC